MREVSRFDALAEAHLNERLVREVKELVKLDATVRVLLERTSGLLGGSLLTGGKLSLWVSSCSFESSSLVLPFPARSSSPSQCSRRGHPLPNPLLVLLVLVELLSLLQATFLLQIPTMMLWGKCEMGADESDARRGVGFGVVDVEGASVSTRVEVVWVWHARFLVVFKLMDDDLELAPPSGQTTRLDGSKLLHSFHFFHNTPKSGHVDLQSAILRYLRSSAPTSYALNLIDCMVCFFIPDAFLGTLAALSLYEGRRNGAGLERLVQRSARTAQAEQTRRSDLRVAEHRTHSI